MGDHTHAATGFGERLRELRARAEMSQADLAERAGMNSSGVAKLEQGVREPSWATALTLAGALGVGVEAFVPRVGVGSARRPPPAKLVRPDEGRLDAATAILRSVQDTPHDRTAWGVLADWLGDRGLQAELLCRRKEALLEHAARRPTDLPTGRRHRDRRRAIERAWQAERGDIEARYGPEPRGEYAARPADVLWLLWGDPATPRGVRAELFLHHCRTAAAPRALVGWLLQALPPAGGPRYTSALELVRRYAGGAELPAEPPPSLRDGTLRAEPHYTSIRGGYDVLVEQPCPYTSATVQRSATAAAANLVDAIYSPDPIAALFGDREGVPVTAAAVDLEGERSGGDALDIRRNPFPAPR